MELPETTKDISMAWLNEVLHENGYLGGTNIVSLRHEQIGAGKGFMSDMAKLTFALDRDAPNLPRTMFAKLPPSYPSGRETAVRLNTFEREIRFYIEVAPQISIRTPILIYGAMDPEKRRYVLLMEDCSYATPADPELQGLTFEQTRLVVTKIADFHARWWNDDNLPSIPWLPKYKRQWTANVDIMRAGWDSCAQIEGFREALPEGGWEAGLKIRDQFRWLVENMPDDKLTLIHYDLRSDNMFFDWRTPENPLIVFDWALACIARGATDLSWLLGGSLTTELRRQVDKGILKSYCERLLDNGISDYTFDECWTDYLRGLLLKTGVTIAGFSRSDLSDPKGPKAMNMGVHRWFSAILDNDATSILP